MLSSPWIALGGAALVVTALSSCASAAARPQIQGRVASGGGTLGDWDFYPSTCAVRKGEVFLLEGGDGLRRVRLIDRGPALSERTAKVDVHVSRETPTGADDLVFTDPSCVRSTLTSTPAGYGGDVTLDCRTGEGGHVVGELTFSGCR